MNIKHLAPDAEKTTRSCYDCLLTRRLRRTLRGTRGCEEEPLILTSRLEKGTNEDSCSADRNRVALIVWKIMDCLPLLGLRWRSQHLQQQSHWFMKKSVAFPEAQAYIGSPENRWHMNCQMFCERTWWALLSSLRQTLFPKLKWTWERRFALERDVGSQVHAEELKPASMSALSTLENKTRWKLPPLLTASGCSD